MSLSNIPTPFKSGLVLLDPTTLSPVRTIALQFNPDKIKRTLKAQDLQSDGGDRSDVTRLKEPAIETFDITAELDLNDQLRMDSDLGSDFGIQPELSALESMIQPTVARLMEIDSVAALGTLEIAPLEAPLVVFVWGESRVLPVKVTSFSVDEEQYDAKLNPVNAKVSIGLRVLSVSDVGFSHPAGSLYLAYLAQKESLASRVSGDTLSTIVKRALS